MTLPTTRTRPRHAPDPGSPGFIGATSHETELAPQPQRRRRRAPLAWLPWAVLGALLGLLLLVVLAGALVGSDTAPDSTSGGSQTTSTSAGGSLTSDGKDLLAGTGAVDAFGALSGKAVAGRNVLVQSVVADEGFWVGSSAAHRVFVYLTPQARTTDGESPFQVRAGQHVDLAGSVRRLGGGGTDRLGVTDAEGANQLAAQQAYVVATSVRLSR